MYHPPEQHIENLLLCNEKHRKENIFTKVLIVSAFLILLLLPITQFDDGEFVILKYVLFAIIASIVYVVAKIYKKNKFNVYFTDGHIEKQLYYGQSTFFSYNELKKLEIFEIHDTPALVFYFTMKKGRSKALRCDLYDNHKTIIELIVFLKSKNKNFTIKIIPPGGELQRDIVKKLLNQKS